MVKKDAQGDIAVKMVVKQVAQREKGTFRYWSCSQLSVTLLWSPAPVLNLLFLLFTEALTPMTYQCSYMHKQVNSC